MKKMFLTGLAVLGILAAGCSKDSIVPETPGNTGQASLRVAIKGEEAITRAVGNPSTDDEKRVHSFTVYVFNQATGVLEASKTFPDGLEGTVSGLGVASQKKVVVFVNQPEGFPAVSNYGDFANASTMISLSTQVPGDFQTEGLFMSGETTDPVTLSTENVVRVPVTVSRLTAKVRLGALTVTPGQGLSIDDFDLKGVTVQQARDRYDALGVMRTSGFGYVGGVQLAGQEASQVDFLHESYSLESSYTPGTKLEPQIYFYVFPNKNTNGNATLLNLYGTYKGNTVYFPFQINNEAGSGSSTTDGNWIERNKIYTLNVTLKKVGNGGGDPNVPNEEVSMDVEISVEDWENELVQEIEW